MIIHYLLNKQTENRSEIIIDGITYYNNDYFTVSLVRDINLNNKFA